MLNQTFFIRVGIAATLVCSGHFLGTWVSSNYDPNQARVQMNWDEGANRRDEFSFVWFEYAQNKNDAGFDLGVTRYTPPTTVADLSTENYVVNGWTSPALDRVLIYQFDEQLNPVDDVSLHEKGFWWMGPKALIFSAPGYFAKESTEADRLDGEFENYIVTNSNLSRDEIVQRARLEYRGSTVYPNGDLYHHYKTVLRRPGQDRSEIAINQVWSIKDVFANQASVPVNRIQGSWMKMGLVPWNFYNLGWKMNLETYGRFNPGSATLREMFIPGNEL